MMIPYSCQTRSSVSVPYVSSFVVRPGDTVEAFLSCSIPKLHLRKVSRSGSAVWELTNLHFGTIMLNCTKAKVNSNCRNMLLAELNFGVTEALLSVSPGPQYEAKYLHKARLPNPTVADNHQLDKVF